jgi:hypothetical protein
MSVVLSDDLYSQLSQQWHGQSGYGTMFEDMKTMRMFHPIKAWLPLEICDKN